MSDRHDYRAFGLRIGSDVPLQFLQPDAEGPPDVNVEFGAVVEDAGDVQVRNWSAAPNRMLLSVLDQTRILITEGNRIRVAASENAPLHELMSCIQGSAFAAMLMQRGLLPLHASCFETGRGAVLAIGSSGLGKSTLLGAMLGRGFRMIADDVTAIDVRQGRPVAIPAYPAVRMWRDSLTALDQSPDEMVRVRPDMEKYYLPVANFRREPQAVHAVIVLGVHNRDGNSLERLASADAVSALTRFTYRKHFLGPMGLSNMQFAGVASLVRSARTFRARRPSAPRDPQDLAAFLIDQLELEPVGPTAGPAAAL